MPSDGEGGTGPLQTDPPVLVGGGGSTLIWIRKDQNPRKLSLDQVPDTADKPAHPDKYEVFILADFVCSQVKVHDGGAGHSVPHRTQGKKHHVVFE